MDFEKKDISSRVQRVVCNADKRIVAFKDQDFAFDPQQGRQNPLQVDVEELARFLPIYRLAKSSTQPMRGFSNFYNPESYEWLSGNLGGLII